MKKIIISILLLVSLFSLVFEISLVKAEEFTVYAVVHGGIGDRVLEKS